MKNLEFKYVKIHPKATVPAKVSGNLAFDLSVVRDEDFVKIEDNGYIYTLKAGERRLFHTGLKIGIPNGYGLILKDRSGLSSKNGLHVLAGVIDSSYIGPILICLLNTSSKDYNIIEGDRIAQAIVIQDYKLTFTEQQNLDDTFRGENGFGHSGR